MNANDREAFGVYIAEMIAGCHTQRDAIKIAALVVVTLHSPSSVERAMDQFGNALCEIWEAQYKENKAKETTP